MKIPTQLCIFCETRYDVKPSNVIRKGFNPTCYDCRLSLPPDEFRCEAITSKNTRCKLWKRLNKKTCGTHKILEDKI